MVKACNKFYHDKIILPVLDVCNRHLFRLKFSSCSLYRFGNLEYRNNGLRHRVLAEKLGSGLFCFEVVYKGKPTEVLPPGKQTAASAIGWLQLHSLSWPCGTGALALSWYRQLTLF